jgi:hypothetical protein
MILCRVFLSQLFIVSREVVAGFFKPALDQILAGMAMISTQTPVSVRVYARITVNEVR